MQQPKLKVIIIGGSIAGLTLARCLELADIDYIVLEKHQDIRASIGGSVGLLPNGCRILDQLGIYDQVEAVACAVKISHMTYPDGFILDDDFPAGIRKRKVLDRFQFQLLGVLYGVLQNHDTVKTGQKVVEVITGHAKVSVLTESGEQYHGNVVIGADGVHSVTRSQMWRTANLSQPGRVTDKETQGLVTARPAVSIEYSCILGISSPVDGITPGQQIIACHDDTTVLVFPGQDGHIGWGLIQKLSNRYTYPHAPRLSHDDVLAMGTAACNLRVYRNITFKDLWIRTPEYGSTLLEEGLLQTWHHGRIVCVGDSVSKMTPNIAQGANTAIEGAASLANALRLISLIHDPSESEISSHLEEYAQRQHKRLRLIHAVSYSATRVHTRRGWVKKAMGRYVYPYTPGASLRTFSGIIAGAPCLDYLPLPRRCRDGWARQSFSGISSMSVLWSVLIVLAAAAISLALWTWWR
ncbi:hypothetical protein BJX70DRAFT_409554 [Aspergillus crustosus]